MDKRFTVHVVPHTHWDREWYFTLEEFRYRLVKLMDRLLDAMERDAITYFQMDGQTIMLEDYLHVRPQNRERFHKLIRDGRLLIGPWYTQPNVFMSGAEAQVRNLLWGKKDMERWDAPENKVNYMPDQFGFPGQLPQMMEGFGLDHLVGARGMPKQCHTYLRWEGVDGTMVHVCALPGSYINACGISEREEQQIFSVFGESIVLPSLPDRMQGVLWEKNRAIAPHILALNGVDHMYYCVILAFNDGIDATQPGIYFWPRVFSLENFKMALSDENILPAAFVSVARTVLGTALTILVTSAFAYGMSKSKLRFRNFYLVFLMIPMYFGGGMVPTYILLRDLHLLNNFWVYIIPGLFSVYYSLIFMSSFRELAPSLEESAMLDGAGYFRIYFQLILPLSKPVIAAICVFLAVGHWNSWMDTLLYMPNTHSWDSLAYLFATTAQRADYLIKLAQESAGAAAEIGQQLSGATGLSTQLASMLISIAPILLVYPFFQKHFVHGVMIGAVKG